MKRLLNNMKPEPFVEDEDMEDPVGPMMVWNGERSKEDRQFMSDWAMARRAELAQEAARSAEKTD